MSVLDVGVVIDGKYRIVRALGEGAWAQVYEGVHERIKRRVAIKILGPELASTPDVTQRFELEARAASQIDSPHVVNVFDVGTLDDGRPYIVMELLDGKDLGRILDESKPLTQDRAVNLVRQAARGLADAHAAGVLHRDVKPTNIFVVRSRGDREVVKIVDLGVSKLGNAGPDVSKLTATNTIVGSPVYMSPEQVRGMKEMDGRSDVYSLGIVLFEAITGTIPFDADSFNELMFKIALEDAPDPRTRVRDLDASLCAIVAKALARTPEARFATAEAFGDALENWQRERGLFPASDPALTASGGHRALSESGAREKPADAPSAASGSMPVVRLSSSSGAAVSMTPEQATAATLPPRGSSQKKVLVGLGVFVAAVAALVLVLGRRAEAPSAVAAPNTGTVTSAAVAAATSAAPTATTTAAPTITAEPAPEGTASATTASEKPAHPTATAAVPVVATPRGQGHAVVVPPTRPTASATAAASAAPSASGKATTKTVIEGRTIRTDL